MQTAATNSTRGRQLFDHTAFSSAADACIRSIIFSDRRKTVVFFISPLATRIDKQFLFQDYDYEGSLFSEMAMRLKQSRSLNSTKLICNSTVSLNRKGNRIVLHASCCSQCTVTCQLL
jgi:hypothetical protein